MGQPLGEGMSAGIGIVRSNFLERGLETELQEMELKPSFL